MPDCKCVSSGLCLHDLAGGKESDNNDFEYVEVDPTGRYVRYKEVLGKGAFKTVYRAFDQEDGIEVAWNQIQVQDVMQTPEDLDRLYSEVNLLKTLKHRNIMKFYHSWVDKKTKNVNFITEIFTSGTLRQYRKRHKHVDIKAVKNWSRQILRGLLYLHSHDPPIIHRDLKCDNILINGNQGEVKIGDLGLATILQHAHAARSVIGTPEFMAPELYEEEYTELADIYSFGMCLLEMVTSEYPYSECSNAAQIFKKVTSGKKPEALKKVKDSDICQFIEKCLAKASKRLPARELLMDPFLRCEGTREPVVSVPHIGMGIGKTDVMDDLAVIMEEPLGISATVQISYKLKETLPNFPDDGCDGCHISASDVKSGPSADYLSNANSSKPTSYSHSKEERARSVDFRVKGNRSEDDTVFLRLRIADPEGQVRNIHFPFDVESDTAMCVASEMVAELDLTDQDVTKIAEMIDAAILALVPEWKPGVAIDETCGDGEALIDHDNALEDGYSSMLNVLDPLTTILSEGLPEQNSSTFPRGLAPEAVSPSRMEGTVYGRFEEVTYQCHRTDVPVGIAEQYTVSIDSSETLKREGDWDPTDSPSSPVGRTSTASAPKSEAVTPLLKECFSRTDVRITNSIETGAAFNELVESKRKAGCSNYTHKTWEGIVQGNACPGFYAGSASIPHKLHGDEAFRQETGGLKLQQYVSAPPSVHILCDLNDECDDESAAQELTELAIKHEQELKELQCKHEEALTELRNRWQRRKSSKSSSPSLNHYLPAASCECSKNVQVCTCKETDSLENGSQNLRIHEVPCRLSRNISKVSSTSTFSRDRCSFQELQGLVPYDVGSVNESVLSFDDLSSLGQFTPRSTLKAAGWQSRDAFVNISSTGEALFSLPIGDGMDCKSSTLRAQNSVKSEGLNLCIPIKSQTVEQMV